MAVPGERRFRLLHSGRHLLPASVVVGALAALWAPEPTLQAALLGGAALLLVLELTLRRRRPVLVLDGDGYRVEAGGQDRLRVAWSEVRRVRHDPAEQALYIDCGDPARNLLVPPSGYGFTFSDREELVAAVLRAVPDRVEEVAGLVPPRERA